LKTLSFQPPISETSFYRCIRCHSEFKEIEGEGLHCGVCGAFYPSIQDVKVFVSNPDQLLKKHVEWLPEKRKELEEWLAKIQSIYDEELPAPESLALMKKHYDGMMANLDVIEKHIEPVRQYLEDRNQPPSFFSEFAGGGWPSIEMLDYFYRDWCGTKEAEGIENLFTDTIERFCQDRSSVAVLGSGAGGVVQQAAEFFRLTFGVELAIDTLLLSRELLNGGQFTLNYSLPKPNFPLAVKAATIEGAAPKRAGIRLLSADVHQLPFRSSSLSCVITNYLTDIVPNQKMVAAEIYRVLAPEGVWLDLSLPMSVSAADQFNGLDQTGFLKRSGFKPLDRRTHRFNFLDLTPLSEWAGYHNQTPVMFAAQKISGLPPQANHFAEYFAGASDAIWGKIPKRVVDISLVHDRRFTSDGIKESRGVAVRHMNDPRPGHFAISDQSATLAEWFLQTIDGRRTIREIFELMCSAYGELIQPNDVIKFFNDLEVSSFIEMN
jgi:SAM-dependent methyltransferase